jgi:hypothetical protein
MSIETIKLANKSEEEFLYKIVDDLRSVYNFNPVSSQIESDHKTRDNAIIFLKHTYELVAILKKDFRYFLDTPIKAGVYDFKKSKKTKEDINKNDHEYSADSNNVAFREMAEEAIVNMLINMVDSDAYFPDDVSMAQSFNNFKKKFFEIVNKVQEIRGISDDDVKLAFYYLDSVYNFSMFYRFIPETVKSTCSEKDEESLYNKLQEVKRLQADLSHFVFHLLEFMQYRAGGGT